MMQLRFSRSERRVKDSARNVPERTLRGESANRQRRDAEFLDGITGISGIRNSLEGPTFSVCPVNPVNPVKERSVRVLRAFAPKRGSPGDRAGRPPAAVTSAAGSA